MLSFINIITLHKQNVVSLRNSKTIQFIIICHIRKNITSNIFLGSYLYLLILLFIRLK